MGEAIPYVYVTATGHSGTTLLAMLLDSHPRIVSIAELDNMLPDIWQRRPYRCSCGQPVRECPFFTEIRDRLMVRGIELDLNNFRTRLGLQLGPAGRRVLFGTPGRAAWLERLRGRLLWRVPAYRRHVNGVFDRSTAIARAAIDVSGKEVFVDTSKSVGRVPHLHRRPDVALRVIHIVRDVRAIAWSHVRRDRSSVERVAHSWLRLHAAALRLSALVGENHYFRFLWEDFCARPQPTLDQISAFLEVEPTDLVARVNARPHHVIGNRMRLDPVGPIRSDTGWQSALGARELAACERIAGKLNRWFGYR